jgi:two-component system cell cycle sensor histidine kinase/response regulator CckA
MTPMIDRWIDRLFGESATAPAPPMRVLAVDDEPMVLRFITRVLQEAGYGVETAVSGADAITVVNSGRHFDLLLTDLVMPEMMGDELARLVRVRAPNVKVLYFTGFADRLFKEKVTLWDSEAFLDKPCSVKGLLEAVSMILFEHTTPRLALPERTIGGQLSI